MAVQLELRYRGLRAPHKLKLGVSGCARECAEARSKDVCVIATEQGWNMYVGGNGGFTPRHAQLLAEGLDDDGLIRAIRSEEHTSELQSLMRISYAVFCLKKKTQQTHTHTATPT